MANAKVKIKIGSIEFTSEGEQEWVTKQLDKILEKAQNLDANSKKVSLEPTDIATANPVITTYPADLFSAQFLALLKIAILFQAYNHGSDIHFISRDQKYFFQLKYL